MDVVLASASPRRKALLKKIYEDFKVIPSDIREIVPRDLPVDQCPEYLAHEKANMVSKGKEKSLVIGCDTAVILEGLMLNKPRDTKEARTMIGMLSGNVHRVVTGCCLIYLGQIRSFSVSTEVEFYELTEEQIENYVKTAEPYDKAGGYGIQGTGALFVKGINGDFYNIVGLPVSRLKREIDEFLNSDEVKNAQPK